MLCVSLLKEKSSFLSSHTLSEEALICQAVTPYFIQTYFLLSGSGLYVLDGGPLFLLSLALSLSLSLSLVVKNL